MSVFKDRERGLEDKFQHDQEITFKIIAKRNKLLGLWAADLLSLPEKEAEEYANNMVREHISTPNPEVFIQSICEDLAQAGVVKTPLQVQKEAARLEKIAREEILKK